MTSFIVDTGAGVNLKCYASGLPLSQIRELQLMSAKGPLSASTSTKVKFRNIADQQCIVLENTPDVISVGQLVAQGYQFHWVPGNQSIAKDGIGINLEGVPGESAYLITPNGQTIRLSIHNRVPYLTDGCADDAASDASADRSDCISEPDLELEDVDNDNIHASPVIAGTRLRSKSKVELSPQQQQALEAALDYQSSDTDLATPHDVLHFHSHKDCSLCREVKQRRNYSRPVLEQFKHTATKLYAKTDIDHLVMGEGCPGLMGESYCLIARDEFSGFVTATPDMSKDTN